MKIILNKDVQNLGEEGDVKEVAPGYARNYLIPKGFGVTYTKQNLALLEGKRKSIEKRKEEKKEHAAGLKERIEALHLQVSMTVGENGRLFGSVTNAMISDELSKHGIEIERKKVEIPEHTIKTTGNFVIKVKLYGNEVASLKVTVAGPAGAAEAVREAPAEAATSGTEANAEGDSKTTQTEEPASAEAAAAESAVAEETAPEAPATVAASDTPQETTDEAPPEESTPEATAGEPPAEQTAAEEPPADAATAEEPTAEEPTAEATAEEPAGEASGEEKAEEPATDTADEEPSERE